MGKEQNESLEILNSTSNMLKKTMLTLVEGLTGVASSKKEEWFLSAGHIFQGLLKNKFLSILNNEWDKWQEKGKIKEDYQESDQHKNLLLELLKLLDNDTPEDTIFSILKKILLVAASETVSDRESILPLQYMSISKKFTAGEIILLFTIYRIVLDDKYNKSINYNAIIWLESVAKESELRFTDLVKIHEDELIKKNLLTKRLYPDGSGVQISPYFRLTSLGYELCKFIEKYDELNESISS
ncbi:MAG TPA: hypothetical protein VIK14_09625 [Ignavibacteria bacterium]